MKFKNIVTVPGDRKDEPCINHRFAAPEWDTPEVMGMQKHGVRFEQCPKCKWILLIKGDRDMTDEIVSEYKFQAERELCLD